MKVPLCLCFILACTSLLHAQEAETDTVATEEEYQYIEKSADDDTDDEDAGDDYEDETPSVTHELVQPDRLPATQDHAHQKMDLRKFDDKHWKEVIGNTT